MWIDSQSRNDLFYFWNKESMTGLKLERGTIVVALPVVIIVVGVVGLVWTDAVL